MTLRVLDRGTEDEVAGLLLDAIDEAGFPTEEAIPGAILAIKTLIERLPGFRAADQALDEAINLLTDEEGGLDRVNLKSI